MATFAGIVAGVAHSNVAVVVAPVATVTDCDVKAQLRPPGTLLIETVWLPVGTFVNVTVPLAGVVCDATPGADSVTVTPATPTPASRTLTVTVPVCATGAVVHWKLTVRASPAAMTIVWVLAAA